MLGVLVNVANLLGSFVSSLINCSPRLKCVKEVDRLVFRDISSKPN